uniref:Uncharacterized protein n=1 Tax=Moniliophthora roreri TaxID=221103 RepID=A0A0W0FYF4_MONRR
MNICAIDGWDNAEATATEFESNDNNSTPLDAVMQSLISSTRKEDSLPEGERVKFES